MLRLSAFLLLILVCPRVDAFCFESAGAKYHIDPLLVKAIAIGESSLRSDVTNINRDKKTGQALSTDYGLMQVNSSHIASLIAQGYIRSSQDLLNRPCLNVQIGTWILAKHFQVCGISWNCLGSYNAGFRKDRHETRESYANRIYAIYRRLLLNERGIKL
ncbi:PilT family plasmid conjugative transfer putative membrane protein [Trabulsiella guamensis ATCC 49490]|uniref:PilT family plasmid conjugative transfer putative membrane protein n=1 Tax=Trabulsiella guamensis ATCC 49490 TaxID=1005994 RepID=A0A084ZP67_9ENTR|nr:lytic transglycosylase domain-containing protein [Trabulsiella guamensis]KFB99261.1 PilT family plasmid conjugative transfer putative membrane protein [Trabulsiella guamensis ATCC 49490]